MDAIMLVRRLWEHAAWADELLWPTLTRHVGAAPWKEYAHILGAEEVWLSRLEGRPSRSAVWPELDVDGAATLREHTVRGYERLLHGLTSAALAVPVQYTNSAGQRFASTRGDILSHVALHGQYHRGKVNALLRAAFAEPVPVDFIAFARGVPAARS